MSKKKKRKRKGSQKGPGYERSFCKQLGMWWTNGKRDDIFWRTASSGARATMRAKKGLRTADSYGDVKAESIIGKPLTKDCLFSLKRGYTGKKGKKSLKWACLLDLIDKPDNLATIPAITKWWEEAMRVAIGAGRKKCFLVFKRDRKNAIIGMQPSIFNELEESNKEFKGQWILFKSGKLTSIIFMKVDDFFSWIDPKTLGRQKRTIKRRKK